MKSEKQQRDTSPSNGLTSSEQKPSPSTNGMENDVPSWSSVQDIIKTSYGYGKKTSLKIKNQEPWYMKEYKHKCHWCGKEVVKNRKNVKNPVCFDCKEQKKKEAAKRNYKYKKSV